MTDSPRSTVPSLDLSQPMWDWLRAFPDDVRESEFFIEEVNRAHDEWLLLDEHSRMMVVGWVRQRERLKRQDGG